MELQEPKHPSLFTIYLSNNLADADKSELANRPEYNIYNHIINMNHRKNPHQLDFTIEDKVIFHTVDSANILRKKRNLRERLQKIALVFEQDFMKKFFNENVNRRIIPFPVIDIYEGQMTIRMQPEFKWILLMIEGEFLENDPKLEEKAKSNITGFVKGDAETLSRVQHVISNPFYWLIRKKQKIDKVWKVSPDQLRKELFIAKSFKRWEDLKTRVLDPVMEDMRGEWTEFDYDYFPKGKGRKAKEIIFTFRKGPEDEKESPAGQSTYEKLLLSNGIKINYVNEIRQRIKTNSVSENGFAWTVDYILFSLEAAEMEYRKKDKSNKPVKNKAAWIYEGLKNGQWLSYVCEKRNTLIIKTQPQLDFGAQVEKAKIVPEDNPNYVSEYARKMRELPVKKQ